MKYLSELYSQCSEGLIAVYNQRTRSSHFYPIDELERAHSDIIGASSRDNVYHRWTVVREKPLSGRGDSTYACGGPGLMLDIDLASSDPSVHSAKNLPSCWEEVLNHLEHQGFPAPTAIRNSGNGVYFDWLFERFWSFLTPEQFQEAESLSRRFNEAAIAAGRLMNWNIDYVGDLSRVTRLPGTKNHKTNPAKDVTLLKYDESRRFQVGEISELVTSLERRLGSKSDPRPSSSLQKTSSESQSGHSCSNAQADFDAVQAGCRWVQWAVDNSERLPEPDWYALAGIAACCTDGGATFHELSAADPRYNSEEASKKFNRADNEAGPRTCARISTDSAFSGCQECPFLAGGVIKSPINLGTRSRAAAFLMSQYAYDVSTARYVNVNDMRTLDEKAFTSKFNHDFPKGTPHSCLNKDHLTLKVDQVDYLPGSHDVFPVVNGIRYINTWKPSSLIPSDGNCTTIVNHLEYLIPEHRERSHFLNVLAHAVQFPSEKIRHVMLLIGSQGTGKSFLGHLISELLGSHNVYTSESNDISDGWTEQLGNRQCLIMEELSVFERREFYEALKRWVTDEMITVNEKHVKKHLSRTPRLIISFSNHSAPINISNDDRRFWISYSPAEPMNSDYYKHLFSEGMNEAGAFLTYLLERDLSDFSPNAAPPMTAAKEEIIKRSEPVLVQEIRSMMEDGYPPFNQDLIELNRLRDQLPNRIHGRTPSTPEIQNALKQLGAAKLNQVRQGDRRIRPWAWRNQDHWMRAEPSEITSTYVRIGLD